MAITVAVTERLEWDLPNCPFKDPRLLYFYRSMEHTTPGLRLLALDWRTITAGGSAKVFDIRNAATRQSSLTEEVQLIHVFHLGYSSSRDATLRDKWNEVTARLNIIKRLGIRCANPVDSLIYGMNKNYLLELMEMGLPVVPTKKISTNITLDQLKKICSTEFQIIKPLNGECGKHVRQLKDVTADTLNHVARETDAILLQPFMPQVLAGEKSLIFLGRKLSHAVRKIPHGSDFRANSPHTGATIYSYAPTAQELELGFQIQKNFPVPLDTFRLDFIDASCGPMIMEVETVDPGHYIQPDDHHARRLGSFYHHLLTGCLS
jgi:glutathione synthase/RimK-type ligase-like ATP-grasp enzyme